MKMKRKTVPICGCSVVKSPTMKAQVSFTDNLHFVVSLLSDSLR